MKKKIYDESLDGFISIKIIGIGASGVSALNYFSDVGHDIFPARFIVSDENDVDGLQAFVNGCDWLFVIMDVEDLELAAQVAKIIEKTKPPKSPLGYQFPLTTFLILCPTAADVRLADIPDNFGTWVVLPKDKIAAIGLTNDEAIYRVVNMTTSIAPLKKNCGNLIGMDFADVARTIGNGGRACIGFCTSLDAENPALDAVKNALQSPLFLEDIRHAKKVLLVFVVAVRREFVDMMKINEAGNFLLELFNPDPDDVGAILWQTLIDETNGIVLIFQDTKILSEPIN